MKFEFNKLPREERMALVLIIRSILQEERSSSEGFRLDMALHNCGAEEQEEAIIELLETDMLILTENAEGQYNLIPGSAYYEEFLKNG